MNKDVYVVYESDQWLTKSKHVAVAVCDNWDSVMNVAVDIMKDHRMKSEEDLEENEDIETIEQALKEFDELSQYRGSDFGVCVELFVMNDSPYSV